MKACFQFIPHRTFMLHVMTVVLSPQMTKHARKHTYTYTRTHTHKQPSISLVWMGRACCFDVGLDGARHLAYACWGKKEEAFISWRVFPIWQVKKKRVRICHIHAI